MIRLPQTLAARNTPQFEATLKRELEALDPAALPLQQGLVRSSYVGDEPFQVTVLGHNDSPQRIQAKVGVFYSGIVAGCNCADDPTPVEGQAEYCEIRVEIMTAGGEARFTLASD